MKIITGNYIVKNLLRDFGKSYDNGKNSDGKSGNIEKIIDEPLVNMLMWREFTSMSSKIVEAVVFNEYLWCRRSPSLSKKMQN